MTDLSGRKTLTLKRSPSTLFKKKDDQGAVLVQQQSSLDAWTIKSIRRPTAKSASFSNWQKKRHDRYREKCVDSLRQYWPALFTADEILPLAIGIRTTLEKDLIASMRKQSSPRFKNAQAVRSFLKQALGYYTHRPSYLEAVAATGAYRYDIDGKKKCAVSIKDRDNALKRLLKIKIERLEHDALQEQYQHIDALLDTPL